MHNKTLFLRPGKKSFQRTRLGVAVLEATGANVSDAAKKPLMHFFKNAGTIYRVAQSPGGASPSTPHRTRVATSGNGQGSRSALAMSRPTSTGRPGV